MSIAGIIEVLQRHDVEFIVVGGVAAVLRGAPTTTFDIDIVYALNAENVDRLQRALAALSAKFRDDPRGLVPDRAHLESRGHKLLITSEGPLDCLGTIDDDVPYEVLVHDSSFLEVGSRSVRVLALRRLIASKRWTRRPKDLVMLPLLEAAADEEERRSLGPRRG
jgi:hypothetical protein